MQFFQDECGAISLDWIVLVAALVGLAIATATVVSGRDSPPEDATVSSHLETGVTTEPVIGAVGGPAVVPIELGPH